MEKKKYFEKYFISKKKKGESTDNERGVIAE